MTDSLKYAADRLEHPGDHSEHAGDRLEHAGADSLHPGDLLEHATDTLAAQVAAAPSPWRDTTARALYGRETILVHPPTFQPAPPALLTGSALFQGFVLLLAATYALLLYHHLGDVVALLRRITQDSANRKRLSEDAGGGFSRFLNTVSAIGLLFAGVVAVKYGDSMMPAEVLQMLPHTAVLAMSLVATAVAVALVYVQWGMLRLAGTVTLARELTTQIMRLKRTCFAVGVIIASPALLLFALCPRGTGDVWFLVLAVELFVTIFLYLKEVLNLFLSKKISILHWFLYLCTVEIFPISLLWLLATR